MKSSDTLRKKKYIIYDIYNIIKIFGYEKASYSSVSKKLIRLKL